MRMRTTVTIEPAVERLLRKAMAVRGHGFKRTLNDALRAGLADIEGDDEPPFEIRARPLGLRPGIDPTRLNSLAGELDDEAFIALSRRLVGHEHTGRR